MKYVPVVFCTAPTTDAAAALLVELDAARFCEGALRNCGVMVTIRARG